MQEMTWFGIWLSYKIQKLEPNKFREDWGIQEDTPHTGGSGLESRVPSISGDTRGLCVPGGAVFGPQRP